MESINFNDIVKKYDLSPMEKIMLSFDIARTSKDNCYGMFEQQLKNNDLEVYMYRLYGTRVIHSRCAIYVEDDKYNLKGVYFFDLGWSLKKDALDDEYRYIYNYFAKPKSYFDKVDKMSGLDDYFIGDFAYIADEFADLALIGEYDEISEDNIDKINNVSQIVDGKSLDLKYQDSNGLDLEKIYEKINDYDLLLDKPIPGEKLLELLFTISKIKYLENIGPEFDLEYLKYTFFNSDWRFKENSLYDKYRNQLYETPNDKMLSNIYGYENIDVIFKTIDFYAENTGLSSKIDELKYVKKDKIKAM